MTDAETTERLPVAPLRSSVLYPHLSMPVSVGRPTSIAAVEAALRSERKEIVVVAQRDPASELPGQQDLYTIGTRAVIKASAGVGPGFLDLIVAGIERVVLIRLERTDPYLEAHIRPLPVPDDNSPEVEALRRTVLDLALTALELAHPPAAAELAGSLANITDPLWLVYLLASMLSMGIEKEQAILEAQSRVDALRLMYGYLGREVQILRLRSKIASEAQTEITREQREYLLRQQLRAIQQELGETSAEAADIRQLRHRLEQTRLPAAIRQELERELSRMERLPTAAADYHVLRGYVEFALELPWETGIAAPIEILRARQVLDEDHYDLSEVKERILEHLGVLKLNPGAKAPILCFVGPPGVGKTSLGQSIARALGRRFERFSLGGMRDEAELRGHRRTYVGAIPGRILDAIRRAGANNPVLMLDEVDKLGRDFRGDPAAALLEVLDPEQNRAFHDNYLDLPFDLSRVLFITTANTLDPIPPALLDRMEVLRLPGYSLEEKLEIARRYLIQRQLEQAGLEAAGCAIGDDTLACIAADYTREAGVRQLERALARIVRKVALRRAEGDASAVVVRPGDLQSLLGPRPFSPEHLRRELPPGVAVGLAWTERGGEILYVECLLVPGARGLTLTGHLGEVMQESARAAQSYILAHPDELGIEPARARRTGVHVHVPAGAVPKDGPSAGTAIAVALASIYTGLPARRDTATTGEITLSGLVLPVGGVKEKVLAARRAGIRRVVLPRENEKDLEELAEPVRDELEFVLVDRVEEVLAAAIPSLEHALAAST